MKHSSRLKLYDFVGPISSPAIARNFTADAAYREARASLGAPSGSLAGPADSLPPYGARLANVRRLREGRDGAGKIGQEEAESGAHANALCPAFRLEFPAAFQNPDNWAPLVPGTHEYLEAAPQVFPRRGETDAPGLGYLGAPGAGIGFVSGGLGIAVSRNMGWGIRVQLPRPSRSLARPLFQVRWGLWTFEIAAGRAAMLLRSPSWTQSGETSLNTLLALDSPTVEQQDDIEEWRALLYDEAHPLSLNRGGGDGLYVQPFTIAWLPEARGQLNVFFGGGDLHTDQLITLPVKSIVNQRIAQALPGGSAPALWPGTRVTVMNNAGHFWWQAGQFHFSYPSFLEMEPLQVWTPFALPSMEWIMQADVSNASTDVTVSNVLVSSLWWQTRLAFTGSDSRLCAFFYGASGLANSGAWAGGRTVLYDSDDHPIGGGSPVADIRPSCEGTMKRRQYEMRYRDVNGAALAAVQALAPGLSYHSGEQRVADLEIDGVVKIKHGLVKISTPSDMRQGTPDLERSAVTRGMSAVALVITDQWSLLEDCLLSDELVFDGLRLGEAIIKLLTYAGVPPAKLTAIATEGSAAGPPVERAALGEKWAETTGDEQSVADCARALMEHYGLKRELWIDNAAMWQMGFRSETVRAAFTTQDAASRHYVLRPLDMPRDAAEFSNSFRAVGRGALGKALAWGWTVRRSIVKVGASYAKDFIGRLKRRPASHNEGWRTLGTLAWIVYSLRRTFGKPPRFYAFQSYWDDDLSPGDRVTFDTVRCEVSKISGGSLLHDRMDFLLQEVFA